MKIAVIGYSGAGKSTCARRLSELLGCPCLHLDAIHFLPGWRDRDAEEARKEAAGFLHDNGAWVIDGNWFGTCGEERLRQADIILFFNFSRLTCFRQARRRARVWRGRVRDSMADGCEEKFDREFALWILRDGRDAAHRAQFREIARRYPDKLVTLKNRRQADAWLAGRLPAECAKDKEAEERRI